MAFKDQKNVPIKARITSTKKLEINTNKGDNEPLSSEGTEFSNISTDSKTNTSPNINDKKSQRPIFFNSKSTNSLRPTSDEKINERLNLKKDPQNSNVGITVLSNKQEEDQKNSFFKLYNKPPNETSLLNSYITKAPAPVFEITDSNPPIKDKPKMNEGSLRDSFKNHFNNKIGLSGILAVDKDNKQFVCNGTVSNQEKNSNSEKNDFLFCSYYTHDVKKAFSSNDSSYFTNLYRDHFFQNFQAFKIFKSANSPGFDEVHKRSVILPEIDPKNYPKVNSNCVKTLIFDLDETLIHCTDSQKKVGEVYLPIVFPTGEKINAGINIRPYAKYALEELSKYYQLVVFTASHSCYANKVIDYLDPTKKLICKRLFRENCIFLPQGVFTKDLRIFANRKPSDLILVDNSPHTYVFNRTNGVPCIPFYDNYNDKELYKLTHFLKNVAKQLNPGDDIRSVINASFKAEKINENLSNFEDVKKNVLMIKN